MNPISFKCGYLTLIGLPNAGKSSLFNRLVGENLAIISPKAQTTWQLMRGYIVGSDYELVVVDTPGIQEGTKALNQALAQNASLALNLAEEGKELIALVIDGKDLLKRFQEKKPLPFETLSRVFEKECGPLPLAISILPVINKVDLIKSEADKNTIESLYVDFLNKTFHSNDVFTQKDLIFVSIKDQDSLNRLLEKVQQGLPQGKSGELFQQEDLTDKTLREIVSEYIREQCFLQLGEELPYSIAVQIESFDEKDQNLTRIEAILHVERDSQKPIVIGKDAKKIKSIGIKAREKIEALLQKKVFLGLRVKVTPHWTREDKWIERFGYGKS